MFSLLLRLELFIIVCSRKVSKGANENSIVFAILPNNTFVRDVWLVLECHASSESLLVGYVRAQTIGRLTLVLFLSPFLLPLYICIQSFVLTDRINWLLYHSSNVALHVSSTAVFKCNSCSWQPTPRTDIISAIASILIICLRENHFRLFWWPCFRWTRNRSPRLKYHSFMYEKAE